MPACLALPCLFVSRRRRLETQQWYLKLLSRCCCYCLRLWDRPSTTNSQLRYTNRRRFRFSFFPFVVVYYTLLLLPSPLRFSFSFLFTWLSLCIMPLPLSLFALLRCIYNWRDAPFSFVLELLLLLELCVASLVGFFVPCRKLFRTKIHWFYRLNEQLLWKTVWCASHINETRRPMTHKFTVNFPH